MLAVAMIAVIEDVLYSATGVPIWNTWHLHPVSIFIGGLSFVGLLYFLQRVNDRPRAIDYVEPYVPLLVFSAANLVLKLNAVWLLPGLAICIAWSIGRVRKVRARRAMSRL